MPDKQAVNKSMPFDNSQTEILVVDDSVDNIKLLTLLLTGEGYKVKGAASGKAALRICKRNKPDLILLDIMMPEMDGYEVCRHLKAEQDTRDIPIIFLSALDNVQDKVRAFQVGGVDYIQKPFEPLEVLARVQTHTKIVALQRKLIVRNDELKTLAETDTLTGLLNRRRMNEVGEKQAGTYSVILFDIDDFKKVNDQHGHHVGDKVLTEVAHVTQKALSGKGYAGRWGGEEFLVLLPQHSVREANMIAHSILKGISNINHMSSICQITASFGVAGSCFSGAFTDVIREADFAMYKGKHSGKNQVIVSNLH
ncbi:diguanylate cyclase [Vibrio rotiferianus]|uniref:diguanylate cyclase n=1 Tax=Vibrio rotiferianus TaxID=190895 RepID=UPI00391A1B38